MISVSGALHQERFTFLYKVTLLASMIHEETLTSMNLSNKKLL